jgi:hypothetical protein
MTVTTRPGKAGTDDTAIEQFVPAAVTDELQALIEEARRRARRRRLAWAAIVIAAAAAGSLAYALTGGKAPGSARGTNGRQPIGATVRSLDLSHAAGFESLAVVGGRLILSGGPYGSLFPSASIASTPHISGSRRCHSAVVNPTTLALSHVRRGPCDDPGLYGVRVLPVNHVANGQGFTSSVRISRRTATGFAIGPVVMRYEEASDTNAEWIYGDGYLWIYDPTTTRGSELLQVSTSTGAVLDTIRMPTISRPLLATDKDGLWFMPSILSGFTGRPTLALYHVKPGARTPVIASRSVRLAHWLVANGNSVWVDAGNTSQISTLWRFDGAGARPIFHRRLGALLDYLEFGYGEPEFGGDGTALWAVVPGRGQEVVRVDSSRGTPTTVGRVQPRQAYSIQIQPPLAVFHGAAYFLDPPAQAATYPYHRGGYSALYQVTPSGARHAR